MEPDDLLCSCNAQPQKEDTGQPDRRPPGLLLYPIDQ